MSRAAAIGRSFGAAAAGYEAAAGLQRLVAERLAARIADDLGGSDGTGLRILEIGCGTGLLTRALRRRLPQAWIVATDLSPAMVASCRAAMRSDERLQLLVMDATLPAVAAGFDLVCSSLALQWLDDPAGAVLRLAGLLAPGGRLQVATLAAGTLAEWQAAHRAEGQVAGGLDLPPMQWLAEQCGGRWHSQSVVVAHPDGLAFLRGLRGIGACLPVAGHRPLGPRALGRVLRRFETDHGAAVSYEVAYGSMRRPARNGVFVTGTDTDIGKTLVSACLVRAWQADYWKPLQTGLAADPGDVATVRNLAGVGPDRLHPPAVALQAPLSPEDAAALDGVVCEVADLALPDPIGGSRPLVVEGAGGVLVPVAPDLLTVALIERLALPVVLVARSTLGTINHTLLSLEALRRRGIRVAGVVLNGPPSASNRSAIERHGRVRILAELPWLDRIDAAAIERLSALIPPLAMLDAAVEAPQ